MPSRKQFNISKLVKWILLGGIAIGFYKAASLPWYVIPIAILFYVLYLRLKALEQTTERLGRTGLPVAGVQKVVEMEVELDDLFSKFALEKFSIPFPNSQREAEKFELPHRIAFKVEYHSSGLVRMKTRYWRDDSIVFDKEKDAFEDKAVIWLKSFTDYVPEQRLHEEEKPDPDAVLLEGERRRSYLTLEYAYGTFTFYGIGGRFGSDTPDDLPGSVYYRRPKEENVFLKLDVFDRKANERYTAFAKEMFRGSREALDFDGAREYNCSPRYVYYSNYNEAAEAKLKNGGFGWAVKVFDLTAPEGEDFESGERELSKSLRNDKVDDEKRGVAQFASAPNEPRRRVSPAAGGQQE